MIVRYPQDIFDRLCAKPVTKTRGFDMFQKILCSKGIAQAAHCNTPGFTNRCFPPGQGYVLQVSRPPEPLAVGNKKLPSPKRSVCAVAGAIECNPDDVAFQSVLCHDGSYVGVMMLNSHELHIVSLSVLQRPGRREIAGMKVVCDKFRNSAVYL